MDFNDILGKSVSNIDELMERVVPRKFEDMKLSEIGMYDTKPCDEVISKPIWDLLDRGGKRWRPFLMKLCYNVVGGRENIDKFLPIVEVIHNGTLMIDDIEDKSNYRRGKDCIHKIYGEDVAINAGNAMYYLPLLSVMKDDTLDDSTKVRIYEIVNEEMLKLHFGQGMDIFWHRGNKIPSEEEYLQMCAFKTGTLARMAAKLGAVLGGANEEVVEALGDFAESLGVSFQIQDDILNICPSENWGKDFGDDISEGKRTLLVIRALKEIESEDGKRIVSILNLRTKDKVLIGEAIGILKNSGSVGYAREVARSLVADAWERLNSVSSFADGGEAKGKLEMFSDFVIRRKI